MRRSGSNAVWATAFLLYFTLVAIPAAHAYVDPGTGSYIFQVVIGAFLGAAVAVKVFWRRIWGFLRRPSHSPAERGAPSDKPE